MIVAIAVIRIGRNRIRPASSMAAVASSPWAMRWLANSTSRIEFFVTKPEEQHDADEAVHVEGHARDFRQVRGQPGEPGRATDRAARRI